MEERRTGKFEETQLSPYGKGYHEGLKTRALFDSPPAPTI
jgi:hypothetical protein